MSCPRTRKRDDPSKVPRGIDSVFHWLIVAITTNGRYSTFVDLGWEAKQ